MLKSFPDAPQLAGHYFYKLARDTIYVHMETVIQSIGWLGTLLIILAYFLISNGHLTTKSKLYQWMNLWGAVGVGVNVFHQQAWPVLALEIAWGAIAIVSIIKLRNA